MPQLPATTKFGAKRLFLTAAFTCRGSGRSLYDESCGTSGALVDDGAAAAHDQRRRVVFFAFLRVARAGVVEEERRVYATGVARRLVEHAPERLIVLRIEAGAQPLGHDLRRDVLDVDAVIANVGLRDRVGEEAQEDERGSQVADVFVEQARHIRLLGRVD